MKKPKLSILTLPEHPGPDAPEAAIFKYWHLVSPYKRIEAFIDRCGFDDLAARASQLQFRASSLTRPEILRELTALQDERRGRTFGPWHRCATFEEFAANCKRIEQAKADKEKAERRRRLEYYAADICPSRDDAQPHIYENGRCTLCLAPAA